MRCLVTVAAGLAIFVSGSDIAAARGFQTIVTFDGSNGYGPSGHIALIGQTGYGATYSTVTSVHPPASPGGPWPTTVIHNFAGSPNDGVAGVGGVIALNGRLFGATSGGGIDDNGACPRGGCGVVYELSGPVAADGTWHETVLYRFTGKNGDGMNPSSRLTADSSGALYGATQSADGDDSAGGGSIFKLTPPVAGSHHWTETVLHHFVASTGDGYYPDGPLVVGLDGAVYGATFYGGSCNSGTIFRLTPPAMAGQAWTESILQNVEYDGAECNYGLGTLVSSGLTLGPDDLLYGTTFYGGTGTASGVLFSFDPVQLIYRPIWKFGQYSTTDGGIPASELTIAADGTIYGATTEGGTDASSSGTAYRLTPANGAYTETILHSFTGGADGGSPRSSILLTAGGAVFGTANGGGANSFGTVFRIVP